MSVGLVKQWVETEGLSVLVRRESGGTPLAEHVREFTASAAQ
ncbi:hypothetical protein [Gilvimarinus sp. 1_MG-2023]